MVAVPLYRDDKLVGSYTPPSVIDGKVIDASLTINDLVTKEWMARQDRGTFSIGYSGRTASIREEAPHDPRPNPMTMRHINLGELREQMIRLFRISAFLSHKQVAEERQQAEQALADWFADHGICLDGLTNFNKTTCVVPD
jgi:hypothetical protein